MIRGIPDSATEVTALRCLPHNAGCAERSCADKMPNPPDSSSLNTGLNPETESEKRPRASPQRIVRVRTRDLPYKKIAHRRPGTIEFQITKGLWKRWRGRFMEIDTARYSVSRTCGVACWQIVGAMKDEADRSLRPHNWLICAHQVEID